MLSLYVNVSCVLMEEPDCKSEEKMLLLKDLVFLLSKAVKFSADNGDFSMSNCYSGFSSVGWKLALIWWHLGVRAPFHTIEYKTGVAVSSAWRRKSSLS